MGYKEMDKFLDWAYYICKNNDYDYSNSIHITEIMSLFYIMWRIRK